MRKLLQKWFSGFVNRIADKYSTRPDKERVHKALDALYKRIQKGDEKKGLIIDFDPYKDRFIIFSDQHKGAKNGSDDFAFCERNYLTALQYYNESGYHFISLGDSEELWENGIAGVRKNNVSSFEKEKLFLNRKAFTKVFGNHDLEWDNSPLAPFELHSIYGEKVPVYEAVILRTVVNSHPFDIFLTHGHQGDQLSDGSWLSKWFVATIWAPLQAYLAINPNTPANLDSLKTQHNAYMYEWISSHKNMLLITGHTHQPVFQSMTHLERLYRSLASAKETNNIAEIQKIRQEILILKYTEENAPNFAGYKPVYFNCGCCCFFDGDITGIEIANGKIKLIKWEYANDSEKTSTRIVLEEADLHAV
jgi:predicted phosphodiesterase